MIRPGSPGPAPTSVTLIGAPPRRAAGSSRAAPRRSGRCSFAQGRRSRSRRASVACSGRTTRAMSSRSRCARAGEAPPVEIATAIGSTRWTAGRMKLQSSGTSTTLQSSPRASASANTCRLTEVVDVAATTRKRPSRSAVRYSRRTRARSRPLELDRDLRGDDGHARAARRAALRPSRPRRARRRRRARPAPRGRGTPCSSASRATLTPRRSPAARPGGRGAPSAGRRRRPR